MLQASDLQEAVVQLWNISSGVSGLVTLVPGGLFFNSDQRIPETGTTTGTPVANPYAGFKLEERRPDRTALHGYVQSWIVSVAIYSNQSGPATGELGRTLDALFDFSYQTFNLANRQTLLVLHSNKWEGKLSQTPARFQATDILLTEARYDWLCQGSTP